MSRHALGVLVLVVPLAFCTSAGANDAATAMQSSAPEGKDEDLDRRTRWLIGSGVGATYLYGLTSWWGDGFGGSFKAEREGWFGRDTLHGGQDKLGHYMFTYAGARLLTWGLESLGHTREKAIWLGATTAFLALSGIEVIDGFAKKWSFGPEDFLMNSAGAAAAVLLETNPKLDRMFDFRIHYSPSIRQDGRRRGWEPISDYAGQTYYFVTKAEGFDSLDRLPGIRYLELSLGYAARGFEGGGDPSRFTYVGVSFNLGKLLREHVIRESSPRLRKVSDNLFEFVQFPVTGTWDERRF
jgi:hypothetical protein